MFAFDVMLLTAGEQQLFITSYRLFDGDSRACPVGLPEIPTETSAHDTVWLIGQQNVERTPQVVVDRKQRAFTLS